MHADYYEGILQLRNPVPEVIEYVDRHAKEFSRVKRVRNGTDYYFISQRSLRALGTTLQRRFPGELKTSRRLHTRNRQTGKAVYRVTVLFRSYTIKKGDLVTLKGDELEVLAIGKKVHVKDTSSGKKRWISYDKLGSVLP